MEFDWEINGIVASYPKAFKFLKKKNEGLGKNRILNLNEFGKGREEKDKEKVKLWTQSFLEYSTPEKRRKHFEEFLKLETPGDDYHDISLRNVRGLFAKKDLKENQFLGIYGGLFFVTGLVKANESFKNVRDINLTNK